MQEWQRPLRPGEKPNTPPAEKAEETDERIYIDEALKKIDSVGIFEKDYLKNIKIVVFEYNQGRARIFENGTIRDADAEELSAQDFMQGRRTDFVGIHPKEAFLNFDLKNLTDKQFLPFLFFKGRLTYEEFVAHEMAHNVFDLQYKSKYGDYDERDGLTDVSEEYRESILPKIKGLIGTEYPNLELDRFDFSRQQISEIYALMCQREYCTRAEDDFKINDDLRNRMKKFLEEPEKGLADFNKENSRNCDMLDFYAENHIVSMIIVPLLEEEYPDFKKRIEFFNL